jgi:hypothetical protein
VYTVASHLEKMAANSTSSNNSVCSVFDTYPYVIVAVVSSGSGILSALCCIFVICLVFLLKKHYFFTQRIILYHCLAALFRSVALITRFHRLGYKDESKFQTVMCSISGFLDQLTSWYLLMDYSVITFTLLMTAVFHKNVARLERLYVVLIFVFPLTFNWIPFINNSYGRSGVFCWIRSTNFDDCTQHKFGYILQFALWNVHFSIALILIIPTFLVVIVVVAWQRCHLRGKSDTLRKTLNEEVWPLLFFPFGLIALLAIPTASAFNDIIDVDNPSYDLHLASAVISPLQGGYIALVYTLNRDTLRQLTYRNLVATLCKRRRGEPQEYPIETCDMSESYDNATNTRSSMTNYRRYTDNDEQALLQN